MVASSARHSGPIAVFPVAQMGLRPVALGALISPKPWDPWSCPSISSVKGPSSKPPHPAWLSSRLWPLCPQHPARTVVTRPGTLPTLAFFAPAAASLRAFGLPYLFPPWVRVFPLAPYGDVWHPGQIILLVYRARISFCSSLYQEPQPVCYFSYISMFFCVSPQPAMILSFCLCFWKNKTYN